jgi:hypothetical protein
MFLPAEFPVMQNREFLEFLSFHMSLQRDRELNDVYFSAVFAVDSLLTANEGCESDQYRLRPPPNTCPVPPFWPCRYFCVRISAPVIRGLCGAARGPHCADLPPSRLLTWLTMGMGVRRTHHLHGLEQLPLHDRLVLAGIAAVLVPDLAQIDPAAREMAARSAREGNARMPPALPNRTADHRSSPDRHNGHRPHTSLGGLT